MTQKSIIAIAASCALAAAFAPNLFAQNGAVVEDAVVNFGQGQPGNPGGPPTHFLDPDDVTIRQGGTVTFIVNGGGHGVAIYPVAKKTTREDIAEDLCQGGATEADRVGRALVCNAATVNLAYTITDRTG